MQLDEPTVKFVVEGLGRRHMVVEKSGFGSRVPKYQQIFCNTEFGSLKFTPQETAIVCELLLRGPQTPGELRSRAPRMAEFPDPGVVESLLEGLANRAGGAHRCAAGARAQPARLALDAVVRRAAGIGQAGHRRRSRGKQGERRRRGARAEQCASWWRAWRCSKAKSPRFAPSSPRSDRTASREPARLGTKRGSADHLERVHDVRVVRAPQEHGRQALGHRRARELGHRAVRIPGAGAREPHRLHHACRSASSRSCRK